MRGAVPDDLGDVIAEVTRYFGWGPRDAAGLTLDELVEWHGQAHRMTAAMGAGSG